jgi:acyl carrier protein
MAMTEQEIISTLAGVIEEYVELPASTVKPEADLRDDLGIDSLSMVEIVVTAVEKFNIEISDNELKHLRTVQDVISYVQRCDTSA